MWSSGLADCRRWEIGDFTQQEGTMKRNALCICATLGPVILSFGCAITDYSPWPGHKTQGEAKLLFQEIAFTGVDQKLDGTYAYSVSYDHSNIPIGAFPTITINSYHNNGGIIVPDSTGWPNGTALPPAFNPDGIADRLGNLSGEYGSYFFFPPWTKDQKWGKFFVSVDTDGDCQFFNNVKQDLSGSSTGPGLALCFNAPSEEVGDIVELEDFKSLDALFGRIWAGSLGNAFTMSLTAISFNGSEHKMVSPLSLAMKSTGMRPSTLAIDFRTSAGKELLQSILNGTVDRAPTSISLSFSGGLKFNLPASWQVAFNHSTIRKALGQ